MPMFDLRLHSVPVYSTGDRATTGGDSGMALTARLSLELLNTAGDDRGQCGDQLTDLADLERWLIQTGLTGSAYPVTARSLEALRRARAAIRGHLEDPTSGWACAALNDVLRWGRRRLAVTPAGSRTTTHVDDVDRRAAWEAATNYIQSCEQGPGRIRRCTHPDCARYFIDCAAKATRAGAVQPDAGAVPRPPRCWSHPSPFGDHLAGEQLEHRPYAPSATLCATVVPMKRFGRSSGPG